jgi:hypothetical protein
LTGTAVNKINWKNKVVDAKKPISPDKGQKQQTEKQDKKERSKSIGKSKKKVDITKNKAQFQQIKSENAKFGVFGKLL